VWSTRRFAPLPKKSIAHQSDRARTPWSNLAAKMFEPSQSLTEVATADCFKQRRILEVAVLNRTLEDAAFALQSESPSTFSPKGSI
jgi:hypothetical protein